MAAKIERAPSRRVHVPAHQWISHAGTDFWLVGGGADIVTASGATNLSGLDSFGWTTTALSATTGSAADFLTDADKGVHTGISIGAASDLLQSPVIFGDYAHGQMAAQILGYDPTTLIVDVYATFTVVVTTSDTTGFGLVEDGGSGIVAADHIAYIQSDGTNFILANGGASDVGALVDTNPHLWRIKVTSSGIEWFIDGTSQGSIEIVPDEWPASFGAGALATTGANFFHVGWVHIYYE